MSIVVLLIIGAIIAAVVTVHQIEARRDSLIERRHPGLEQPVIRPELHTVRFLKLPAGAFFKLMMLLSSVTGFCYGLFLTVAGLLDMRVTLDFFGLHLRGTEAIAAAPFITPVFGAICGLLAFLPAWLVTNWLLAKVRGIDLTGVIANVASNDQG